MEKKQGILKETPEYEDYDELIKEMNNIESR